MLIYLPNRGGGDEKECFAVRSSHTAAASLVMVSFPVKAFNAKCKPETEKITERRVFSVVLC